MAGNPFNFNRDGRWSTSERAFTHYGVDSLVRGEDPGGASPDDPAGCGGGCLGCLSVVLVASVGLLVLLALALLFSPGA